jgi:hypothetical protein
MRLYEFESSCNDDARVKRLKDNAEQARDKAKQLSAQASISANQVKAKKAKIKAVAVTKPVLTAVGAPGWDH